MKKYVLITGASTGIGRDLAMCFAENNYNLVLVSRSLDKLIQVKDNILKKYSTKVLLISKDLSKVNSATELKIEIEKQNIFIHTLVNNAGVGYAGEFNKINYQESLNMNLLNMITLSNLCHLFSTEMINQKCGQILNIASVAAFQPGPFMSAYYASKSFVLNYTLGIREELKNYNIKVSCLCPGATMTNFFDNPTLKGSNLTKVPWSDQSSVVAQAGYNGLINGKAITIPGLINSFMAMSVRFTPRCIVNYIILKVNK